jgi:hypothetical protein
MPVDIERELRALGADYDRDAPAVTAREIRRRRLDGAASVSTPLPVRGSSDRSPRRRVLALATAAIVVAGVAGVAVVARSGTDDRSPVGPAVSTPNTTRITTEEPTYPSMYPVVGDAPGPGDHGSFSVVSPSNPARAVALIARRDGDTIVGGLTITATATPTVATAAETVPLTTAPAEAVGEQTFEIHGQVARVWTEPGEERVQHVQFTTDPVLEIAGVDALAFIQAAGQGAIVASYDPSAPGQPPRINIGTLPAGYQVVVEPMTFSLNTVVASIGVGGTDTEEGNGVEVELANPLPGWAAYSTFTEVDINGHTGWVESRRGHHVIWEPAPGTYAMAGGADNVDDAVAFARSVRFVDRQTWQAFYNVDDPHPAIPPTTIMVGDPGSPPYTVDPNYLAGVPPVSAPLAISEHLGQVQLAVRSIVGNDIFAGSAVTDDTTANVQMTIYGTDVEAIEAALIAVGSDQRDRIAVVASDYSYAELRDVAAQADEALRSAGLVPLWVSPLYDGSGADATIERANDRTDDQLVTAANEALAGLPVVVSVSNALVPL